MKMLASNLERGRDNMMQTELPSHADVIFSTVGKCAQNNDPRIFRVHM